MYRMIIADDEAIERFAFRTVVSKEFPEIEIIGEAASGKEVLQKSMDTNPDIIIMDIKMPGINGIEAARQIKSRLKSVHVIILTAYDNFNYIQEGLKLGIDDYLLKPSKKEKIIQVLKRTIGLIEEERRKQEEDERLVQKVEEMRPVIENQLISSLVFEKVTSPEVKSYLKFLDIEFSQGFVMAINIGGQGDLNPREYAKLQTISRDAYNIIYPMLHNRFKCAVSFPVSNNIVLIISTEKGTDEYRVRVMSMETASGIQSVIRDKFFTEIYVGIGNVFDDISNMDRSYREALEALKTTSVNEDIKHFGDISTRAESSLEYPVRKEKGLLEAVKLNEIKKCSQYIDDIFSWMFNHVGSNFPFIKTYVISLVGFILRIAVESGVKVEKCEALNRDLYGELQSINDIWNLKKWFEDVVNSVFNYVASTRNERLSGIIDRAKSHIAENYMKEVTLEKVAELVLLSPQHFSRIFKQETGMNFVDYLTEVQLKRSKELLQKSFMNVKEISYSVGYNDPNYFFKVFKKATDMTPGDYRKKFSADKKSTFLF